MRAKNRTMLASLGFADPDRRHEDHDLACQYLSTAGAKAVVDEVLRWRGDLRRGPHPVVAVPRVKSEMEVTVTKGSGDYKTTVGFIDVQLRARLTLKVCENARCSYCDYHRKTKEPCTEVLEVNIEVKGGPSPVSEILRQMRVYQEYTVDNDVHHRSWAVATIYEMGPYDVAVLERHGILHVQLGRAFAQWKSQRGSNLPAVSSLRL